MNHSTHQLNVNNVCEFTRFFQIVESFHLHHLSGNFVCNLKKRKVHNSLVQLYRQAHEQKIAIKQRKAN